MFGLQLAGDLLLLPGAWRDALEAHIEPTLSTVEERAFFVELLVASIAEHLLVEGPVALGFASRDLQEMLVLALAAVLAEEVVAAASAEVVVAVLSVATSAADELGHGLTLRRELVALVTLAVKKITARIDQ